MFPVNRDAAARPREDREIGQIRCLEPPQAGPSVPEGLGDGGGCSLWLNSVPFRRAEERGAALGFPAQVKTKTHCRTLQFSIAGTLIIPFPSGGRTSV